MTWPVRSRPARRVLLAAVGLLIRRRLRDAGAALSSAERARDSGRTRWPWLLVLAVVGSVAGVLVRRRRRDDRPPHDVGPRAASPATTVPAGGSSTPAGARTDAGAQATGRNGLAEHAPGADRPDPANVGVGRAPTTDDLKVIEGIGPKIEQLLKDNGVHTWQDLAAADVERLRGILQDAGSRYHMHDPGTWPRQAALLVRGDWEGFEAISDGEPGT